MMDGPAREAIFALLAKRSPDASICPSEVARAIAIDGDWRKSMPTVHATADALVEQKLVQLSWKGEGLERRSGPYRISGLRGRH